MNTQDYQRIRYFLVLIISVAIWSLLSWQHWHGGVPSHHPLADEQYPAISNWWGALVLPVLSWFLTGRSLSRIARQAQDDTDFRRLGQAALWGGLAALAFSLTLAWCFLNGYEDLCGWMLLAAVVASLFFPLYRAEYLLGFVLGMTYAIGAVLPTIIGTIYTAIAAVLYLLVRAGLLRGWQALKRLG